MTQSGLLNLRCRGWSYRFRLGTPAKSEKPAGGPETRQAPAEPVAAPVTPAEGAKQSFDRMLHTLATCLGLRLLPPSSASIRPTLRRLAGPYKWQRQNLKPTPRAISGGSTPNMRPRSMDRRLAYIRPSSMARLSTDCVSSTCPGPTLRLFAQDSKTTAAAASSPSERRVTRRSGSGGTGPSVRSRGPQEASCACARLRRGSRAFAPQGLRRAQADRHRCQRRRQSHRYGPCPF